MIVSADTDFGTLLAQRSVSKPSVILFRKGSEQRAADQALLLVRNLVTFEADLEQGSVVIFQPGRLRVRRLPLT